MRGMRLTVVAVGGMVLALGFGGAWAGEIRDDVRDLRQDRRELRRDVHQRRQSFRK